MRYLQFKKSCRIRNKIRIETLRRTLFLKFIFKRIFSKYIYFYPTVSFQNKLYLRFRFTYVSKYSVITQQKTKCIETGKSNMPFRFCLLARINFKNYIKSGYMPYLSKSKF